MNRAYKLISVLAILLILAFALYGSTKDIRIINGEGEESAWLGRSGNLTIWYTDDRLSPYITKMAVEFGEKEDITVVPVLKAPENFLEECYSASMEGSSYPDIIITGSETLEKAYLSGLASEIKDDEMQIGPLNFCDAAVNAVTYKGKKVGFPLTFDVSVMVYNRTYLEQWASQMALADLTGTATNSGGGESETEEEEQTTITEEDVDPAQLEALTQEYITKTVPYTLEDLMTIANSYSVPEGVEGIMSWDVSSIMYNYWIVGSAIDVGSVNGDDRHSISVNNDTAVACLEKYQSLHNYFSIESSEVTYESVIQDFIDGKTVFTIGGYDLVKRLQEAADDGSLVFEYGFSEMPNVTSDIPSRSLAITSVACVNGYSSKKELAERFALSLTRDEEGKLNELTGLAACARTFGWEGGANQIYALEYETSVSLPKMMETENFWMELETMFARIWEGGDAKEQLSNLESDLNSVLNTTL